MKCTVIYPCNSKKVIVFILFAFMLLSTGSFAQGNSFTLPGDGKWYRLASGGMGYLKYSYIHLTAHDPASVTGELHLVNYNSVPLVQEHHAKGYATDRMPEFAIVDHGNWVMLWVKAKPGVLAGTFRIEESHLLTLYLGDQTDTNLNDNGAIRPVEYIKIPVNGHLFSAANFIVDKGKMGIGTTSPDEKLTVKGKIHAEEVKVDLSVPGPDYVFDKNYELRPLDEVKAYIHTQKRLPEVPSAVEMEVEGIKLGEMNMILLRKIEELVLYTIAQEERIGQQARDIALLRKENKAIIRSLSRRFGTVKRPVGYK